MVTRRQAKTQHKASLLKVSAASKPAFKAAKKSHAKPPQRERYYKQFDFFFTRTCFRYMNEYYKDRYAKFERTDKKSSNHAKILSSMSKDEMDKTLRQFITHLFGPELLASKAISADQKQQLVQSMMIFVFAHRHSKGDKFIVETQKALEAKKSSDLHFDFSIVRNVMYMYSKKA